MFWVDVEVEEKLLALEVPIEYKFVATESAGVVRWEGQGEADNRRLRWPDTSANISIADLRAEEVALLPVASFRDGDLQEASHTGRYYSALKSRQGISFQQIVDRVFLGSCPRRKEQVLALKNDHAVDCVLNLQTEEDCQNNALAGIGMEEEALSIDRFYQDHDISYVWLPTRDMSTEGRALMMPQGALVLHSLLAAGHVVYVHCNAGVGRSTAVVCAYLIYVVGLSPLQAHHYVAARRPVVYFDGDAVEDGHARHKKLYGPSASDATMAGRCDELLRAIEQGGAG